MEILHLSLFFLPLVIFLFFLRQYSIKETHSSGPKRYPLLGTLPEFIKNRHRFLDWSTEVLGRSPGHTFIFRSLGQKGGFITASPAVVEHMLKTNFENYPKGERSFEMLVDLLGHGIFNSDGEEWRRQRKAASYEFNRRSLRNFVVDTVQDEVFHRLLPLLRRAAEKSEIVDLQNVLERFAFDSICKVAFNEDPACLTEEAMRGHQSSSSFMRAFAEAQNIIAGRFLGAFGATWRIKRKLRIGSERRLKESVPVVHNYAMEIIQARKEKNLDEFQDLLSRFASNKDNSDEFLRDIVVSFILAGRETTSSALTWFFWILSTRPDVRQKIHEEINRVKVQSKHQTTPVFGFDELREMHYIHAAVTESMRLYPPVPVDSLACQKDDILPDGTRVVKGMFAAYIAYAMGRMKSIWGEDCHDYKPERWLENGSFRPESPFRYPVFHAGPRMCLGKEMAYIQMKYIIACVLDQFEIEVVGMREKEPPDNILSMTLRMKGGLPIRVRGRSTKG